jgi:hypothetical protein
MQLDAAVAPCPDEPDVPAPMSTRVVEHVRQRLLEPTRVRAHDQRLGFDLDAVPLSDLANEVGDIDLLEFQRHTPVVSVRKQQQAVRNPRQLCRGLGRKGECLAQLFRRAGAALGELELRREQRERRTQLMAASATKRRSRRTLASNGRSAAPASTKPASAASNSATGPPSKNASRTLLSVSARFSRVTPVTRTRPPSGTASSRAGSSRPGTDARSDPPCCTSADRSCARPRSCWSSVRLRSVAIRA